VTEIGDQEIKEKKTPLREVYLTGEIATSAREKATKKNNFLDSRRVAL